MAVGTVTGTTRRALASPVHVGRDDQLRLLADVVRRPPSLALVEGQAGVGKTRLVTELARHPGLSGTRVLVGNCHRLREPFPLGPVVAALGGLVDLPMGTPLPAVTAALRPLIPELDPVLPGAPVAAPGPAVGRHILFRAIVELLASVGPTLFVVEDLHWGDDETVELLRYLVDRMPPDLALVVTYRREELDPGALSVASRSPAGLSRARIELQPLAVGDVKSMTKAILGAEDLSPELATAVHRRTAGLPFAVEELVRLMADEGVLDRGDGLTAAWALDELRAPPAVRDSVLERVAALAPDARRVVDAAAVLDVVVPETLLAQVCGLSEAASAAGLSGALRSCVLLEVEPGGYGFRHPLAAQSVYEAIPGPERRRLHHRAATALESSDPRPVARLAYHYRAGGDGDRWLHWAEVAADLAADRGDSAAAVRFLTDVLSSASPSDETRRRLAVKLGKAALACGVTRQREAVALLRGIVDDDPNGKVAGALRRLLGALVAWSGDAAGGYGELSASVPDGEACARLRVHVMTELAVFANLGLTVDERLRWLALADHVAADLDDAVADIEVTAARADILVHQGDPSAWDAVGKLPTAATSPGAADRLAWGWLRLAWGCLYLGYDRRSRDFLDCARRIAGDSPGRLVDLGQGLHLVLRLANGDWQGLEAAAATHHRAMSDMATASVAAGQVVGLLALGRGDDGVAEATLTECLERATAAGMARSVAVASAGLARLALRRMQPVTAMDVAERGLAAVTAGGSWVWAAELVPTAVEASLAGGAVETARRTAAVFARAVSGCDSPLAEAAVNRCRAVIAEAAGDHHGAAEAYAAAEELYAAMPRPHEAAMARARRGRCMVAAGGRGGAGLLIRAGACLRALGAPADAEEIDRALATDGVAPVGTRAPEGRRREVAPLTFRENQVADLGAQGLTNNEIAALLHLSPRTVEAHVAKVVRKLGLPSKRALITTRGGLGPQ